MTHGWAVSIPYVLPHKFQVVSWVRCCRIFCLAVPVSLLVDRRLRVWARGRGGNQGALGGEQGDTIEEEGAVPAPEVSFLLSFFAAVFLVLINLQLALKRGSNNTYGYSSSMDPTRNTSYSVL